MAKSIVSCLSALEMLISKGHLIEVHSKEFHEEEDSEQGWKYTSDIGQNVHHFKISPSHSFSSRRSFNIKVSLFLWVVFNWSSMLHRLAAVALFSGHIRSWPNAVVCFKYILVNEYFVVVKGVRTDVHIVSSKKVLEWLLVIRVDEWIQLIDHSRSTKIDWTGDIASNFNLERSGDIADIEPASQIDLVIQRQAHPVADTKGINIIFDLWDIWKMCCSTGFHVDFFLGFILVKVASIEIVSDVPKIQCPRGVGTSSILKSYGHHIWALIVVILIGADGCHSWLEVDFFFEVGKDCRLFKYLH